MVYYYSGKVELHKVFNNIWLGKSTKTLEAQTTKITAVKLEAIERYWLSKLHMLWVTFVLQHIASVICQKNVANSVTGHFKKFIHGLAMGQSFT